MASIWAAVGDINVGPTGARSGAMGDAGAVGAMGAIGAMVDTGDKEAT